MTAISKDDRLETVDGLDVNEVPDGMVIYDNDANKVHYLNTTASVIYQLLDGKLTVAEIGELLQEAFGLSEDIDVATNLGEMLEAKLICKVA